MNSARSRLMFLISVLAIVFILAISCWHLQEQQRSDLLAASARRDLYNSATRLLELKGSDLASFAKDYSYWDEMVSFARTRDMRWAQLNLMAGFNTYKTAVAAVFNEDGVLVYSMNKTKDPSLQILTIRPDQVKRIFAKGPFAHFFMASSGKLFEVRGSTIVPGADLDHATRARGYWFVSKVWDAGYLASVSSLLEARVSLESPTASTKPEADEVERRSIVVHKKLLSLDGKPVASLHIHKVFQEGIIQDAAGRHALALLSVFAALMIAVLYVGLARWVTNPVRALSHSMRLQSPNPLASLARDRSEFGQLAALIRSFFEQKAELERETNERIKAEEELRRLNGELEERVTLRTAELAKARDEALQSAKAKSEFLANISHEIRTPMNGIIGMTQLAMTTGLTDEQQEYLEAVATSSDALLALINAILDFSTIDSKQLELAPEPFALRDSIQSMMPALTDEAHEKGLALRCEVAPQAPDQLVGDVLRLQQVITNLIGNAIKFTEQGEVALAVDLECDTGGEVELRFTVSDTGIGIPPNQQQQIFAAFQQADGSVTRRYGGSGLGLAIASELVQMMGGRMWLESEVGRGSSFYFTARVSSVGSNCNLAA